MAICQTVINLLPVQNGDIREGQNSEYLPSKAQVPQNLLIVICFWKNV